MTQSASTLNHTKNLKYMSINVTDAKGEIIVGTAVIATLNTITIREIDCTASSVDLKVTSKTAATNL